MQCVELNNPLSTAGLRLNNSTSHGCEGECFSLLPEKTSIVLSYNLLNTVISHNRGSIYIQGSGGYGWGLSLLSGSE